MFKVFIKDILREVTFLQALYNMEEEHVPD